MMMKRLRPRTPPITQAMEPQFLKRVLNTLFPTENAVDEPFQSRGTSVWKEEYCVTASEVAVAIKKIGNRKAPGPDGIPGVVIKSISQELSEPLAHIFTECLKQGWFPEQWKEASLVLLRNEGKPEGSPSAYRPICLLAEFGKLLERIIARRLMMHMRDNSKSAMAEEQYGFREHRSTVDAICSFKNWVDETIQKSKGVTMAISLDVANAFNSIPWKSIAVTLEKKNTSLYSYNILRTYFCNRSIVYINQEGIEERFVVTRRVPQSSVLGLHLWNVAYDSVLSTAMPTKCRAIGYADDTLVLAKGSNWQETIRTANHATACITRAIKSIGLTVAPGKTEAAFYHDGTHGAPPNMHAKLWWRVL